MTKTTDKNIDERQANIGEVRKHAEAIIEALDNAESCETPNDFDANMRDVRSSASQLLESVAEVLS